MKNRSNRRIAIAGAADNQQVMVLAKSVGVPNAGSKFRAVVVAGAAEVTGAAQRRTFTDRVTGTIRP